MIKIREPLQHRENYGIYNQLIDTGYMVLRTDDVNEVTYDQYFQWLVNVMVDGIEHPIWHGQGRIKVIFSDGVECVLMINDFLLNLIMWYMAIKTNTLITSQWLIWDECITQKTITSFINKNLLDKNRKIYTNRYLNNVIAECTDKFSIFDRVSKYLSDSINFYDDIVLMDKCPEYYDCLHLDISGQPIDKVRQVIDEATDKAVNIIKYHSKEYLGYYHSLASNFRSGEALNKKQFGETYIAIGTKPDASGNVIPYIISNSFINGGVQDNITRYVESYAGRKATIMSHMNVSTTGTFARKLMINNQCAYLNPDPNYFCNTRNAMRILVKDYDTLRRLDLRYYMETSNGVIKECRFTDTHLIGKWIYLFSPMTCASYANGHGICRKCYGNLYYVNRDINIGSIAATLLSSVFTQRMLSAKHLLETVISVVKWCVGFDKYFRVDTDQIIFDPDLDPKGYKIIINVSDIEEDDDNNDDDYDEDDDTFDIMASNESSYYITKFILEEPNGTQTVIESEDSNKMYLIKEMYSVIAKQLKKLDEDDQVVLDLASIDTTNMMTVSFENSELSKSLDIINKIIDKVSVTATMTKEEFLQSFLDALNNASIKMNAVHSEVLLSNQMRRSKDDILNRPMWEYDNASYTILSLRQSLSSNPNLVVSLSYQDISNQLNTGVLTCEKSAPSIFDLSVLKKPQQYIQSVDIVRKADDNDYQMSALGVDKEVNERKLIDPFVIISKK